MTSSAGDSVAAAVRNGDDDDAPRKINTIVFLDLETSDLYSRDKPKIMELCMVAVHRTALCESAPASSSNNCTNVPRVLDKITLCFNPNKPVSSKSFELTGLDNCNLMDSAKTIFDENAVKMMHLFLGRQQGPVCVIAHNGDNFDFRLLRTELRKINQNLGNGVLCADSLIGFYETDQEENALSSSGVMESSSQATPAKRMCPEVTPDKQKVSSSQSQAPKPFKRMMPYGNGSPSYSLASIFQRTVGGKSIARAHNAEGDVLGLIQVCKTRGEKLCRWIDKKARDFNDVELYYMPSPPRGSKRSLQF